MSRAVNWALALALGFTILAPTAEAGGLSLVLHGASHHFHERQKKGATWNEQNPGAALRWEFSPVLAVQGGAYRDSLKRNSLYVLGDYTPASIGPVRAGLFAGGRVVETGRAMPVGGAVVRWDVGPGVLALRASPKVQPKSSAVVAVEWAVKL